ncbi:MAG: hypothetical protein ACRD2C_25585 [Acidimicrobiales bacterium]
MSPRPGHGFRPYPLEGRRTPDGHARRAAAGRRRAGARRVALATLAVTVLLGAAGCGGTAQDVGEQPADRVLLVSLPGVSWDDVRSRDLPNLQAFVDDAAIGDLSTRIGRRDAAITDAYLTIGAGTRSVAPNVDRAVALDPDESYGGVPAWEILERRLGDVPEGIFYLAIGEALDDNDGSVFGAEVGALGDALDDAGVGRAVIANADSAEGFVSDEPPPDGAFVRAAATALMDSDGIVPGGTVGRGLLTDDPDAPFGRRLDPRAVTAAFDRAWDEEDGHDRNVVLVEASDLVRASFYGPRATGAQRSALRSQALIAADAQLGDLLERVDREHDAVVVLSPVAPGSSPALGIVAVQAPGIDAGLLESATTRRAGYVQLADVAPTVLALLGEDALDGIEGEAFQVVDEDATGRVDGLADAADAARFRDQLMPLVVTLIIVVITALVLATSRRVRLPRAVERWRSPIAFAVLGVVPATFLVGRIDAVDGSTVAYLAAVALMGALWGVVAARLDRRRPGLGAIASLALIVALVAADVLLGAPLQLNTMFGYSVGVAGRFAGLGNLAFALFGSATILLAVLVARRGGARGLRLALLLLAGVVLIEGLPMLGADVGGTLSMVPAFGVTALVLSGRRVGLREAAGLAAAAVVVVLGFAFIDSARTPDKHTHLARLAESVVDGRWGPFVDSLSRRWQASFGGAELAGWITVGAILLSAGLYVVLVGTGRMGVNGPRWDQWTNAAVAGLVVLGVVGLIANDSSFAVPATMLIVVGPLIALRNLRAMGVGAGVTKARP